MKRICFIIFMLCVAVAVEAFPPTPPAPPASSTVPGIVELATDAEAKAATDTTKALTPANMMAAGNIVATGAVNAPSANIGAINATSISAGNVVVTGAVNAASVGAASANMTQIAGANAILTGAVNAPNANIGAGNFSSIAAANADINAGTIDGATIGVTTPAAGSFTTLKGNPAVVTVSSTRNLTADELKGQDIIITGAYTASIPAITTTDYQATAIASTAATFCLDVATGTDLIILNGTPLTAGNKACSDGTINNMMKIRCPIAGKCFINSLIGLAVDGGA
jgi:hypothetical protein